MVVSLNRGGSNIDPQTRIILIMGTAKRYPEFWETLNPMGPYIPLYDIAPIVTLILGNLHVTSTSVGTTAGGDWAAVQEVL